MESCEEEINDNEQKAVETWEDPEDAQMAPEAVDIDDKTEEPTEDFEKLDNGQTEKEENPVEVAHGFDEDDDSDEDDDTYNVIIKPSNTRSSMYKTGVTYQARSQAVGSQHSKVTRQGINLNDPGNVNGSATIDFNLDTLGDDEKPWKRPGADITDYFNYGFTEDSWTQYCEKQKILRQEYANASLKPVVIGTAAGLGLTGLSLAQRNRFVGLPGRSYDSYNNKSSNAGNINVINLSSNPHGDSEDDDDEKSDKEGSVYNGNSRGFAVPPPGYGNDQSAAALAQLNAVSAFNIPPPGFGSSNLAAPVLNTGSIFTGPAGQHVSQAGWPSSNVRNGLISLLAGPPVRSTAGRSSNEHRGRTPENLFSDDEYQDNRRSSRYHGVEDTEDRYDRDQHRSTRRSRSRSRDRRYSSRSRRHHEDSSSSRDYGSRHSERSSRRRSRDRREHRSDRTSGTGADYLAESSSRDRRHRESRRSDARPAGSSSSSRQQTSSRRSRVSDVCPPPSKRRGRSSPSPLSPVADDLKQDPEGVSPDPLAAASVAAANIASRIKLNDSLGQNFV